VQGVHSSHTRSVEAKSSTGSNSLEEIGQVYAEAQGVHK
jgi:hypothetical protein